MAKVKHYIDNWETMLLRTFAEKYFADEAGYNKMRSVRFNLIGAMKATAAPSVVKAYETIEGQIWDKYERPKLWAAGTIIDILREKCPRYEKGGVLIDEDEMPLKGSTDEPATGNDKTAAEA